MEKARTRAEITREIEEELGDVAYFFGLILAALVAIIPCVAMGFYVCKKIVGQERIERFCSKHEK